MKVTNYTLSWDDEALGFDVHDTRLPGELGYCGNYSCVESCLAAIRLRERRRRH